MLQYADQQSAHNIYRGNQNRRQCILLIELCCAIQRAIKLSLACNRLPAFSRAPLINQARIHISVNGHLLSRQSIERKSRRYLSRPHSAVANDKKLNRNQRKKEHQSNDIISANNKLTK